MPSYSPPSSVQIETELQRRILTGDWRPGEAIPTERELVEEFGVSQTTVKKALGVLKTKGMIRSHQGKGRFVSETAGPARTWTLGVIMSTLDHLSHPLHSRRLAGIQKALSETSYHLTIHAISSQSDKCVEDNGRYRWLGLVDPTSLDGVIVHSRHVTAPQLAELAEYLPVCCVNRQRIVRNCACVRGDYYGAALDAAAHLVRLGHRRLAFVTVNDGDPIGEAQMEGARLALRESVCPHAQDISLQYRKASGFTVEEGSRLGDLMLDREPIPTGIICGSDELALGLYRTLAKAGVRIPQDVSLVGWNDTLTAEDIPVAMTTVQRNPGLLGQACVEQLLKLMEEPSAELETCWIPMKLVVRDSTAPPRC